jgi:hypothetical protein
MKKLLFLLLIIPITSFGQISHIPMTTTSVISGYTSKNTSKDKSGKANLIYTGDMSSVWGG